jgi:RHS repeat-associated protein
VSTCTGGKKFTYPAANPTTPPARPHAPTAITGLANPTYDAAGSTLTGNSRTYSYDAEGQVASVAFGGTTLSVNYAGDGKAWKLTSGSLTRYRIYDDFEWTTANLARTHVFLGGQEIAVTEEGYTPVNYGGCGQVWPPKRPLPAGGDLALTLLYAFAGALAFPMVRAIRRHRLRGARAWASLGTSAVFLMFVSVPPQLVAEPAEASAPLNTTFFHPDRLGSSLVVSDNTGTASARRVVYRPFGALVQNSAGNSTVPDRGFTGQRFESSVGVYDYGARWYDPAIARFVQPDNYADPFEPQSLNLFAYVRNDPTNRTDPTGNWGIQVGFQIGNMEFGNWGTWGGPWGMQAVGIYLAGRGWSGCINIVSGQCGNNIIGGIVNQAVGRIQSQVSLISNVIWHPVATARALVDALVNPSDLPMILANYTKGETVWRTHRREIQSIVGEVKRYIDYGKQPNGGTGIKKNDKGRLDIVRDRNKGKWITGIRNVLGLDDFREAEVGFSAYAWNYGYSLEALVLVTKDQHLLSDDTLRDARNVSKRIDAPIFWNMGDEYFLIEGDNPIKRLPSGRVCPRGGC